jgi:hypothetical protein
MNIVTKKLSIAKINENENRKSIVKLDKKFEFNAPKYIDFEQEPNKQLTK